MKTIKFIWKILKFTGCTLMYILYVLITLNARTRYMNGVNRGMHCTGIESNLLRTADTYHYDRNKEPEREYATWKEFRFGLNF